MKNWFLWICNIWNKSLLLEYFIAFCEKYLSCPCIILHANNLEIINKLCTSFFVSNKSENDFFLTLEFIIVIFFERMQDHESPDGWMSSRLVVRHLHSVFGSWLCCYFFFTTMNDSTSNCCIPVYFFPGRFLKTIFLIIVVKSMFPKLTSFFK